MAWFTRREIKMVKGQWLETKLTSPASPWSSQPMALQNLAVRFCWGGQKRWIRLSLNQHREHGIEHLSTPGLEPLLAHPSDQVDMWWPHSNEDLRAEWMEQIP